MSAPSPATVAGALVTFTIKVEGKAIDSTIQVVSVDTWQAVNRVPRARVVLYDGSAAEADFPLSDLKTFVPGQSVEIALGYDNKEVSVYRGVIVRQGLEISQQGGSRLIIDLTDEAIKMTLARHNALFEKIKDSDLIGKLITASGLSKDVASTNTVHEDIVQYYASDWDLMVTRAEQNGLVVMVDAGKVTVKAPDTSQAPVLTLSYGDAILDLRTEMDAATQYAPSAIKSSTWDIDSQKLIEAGPGSVAVSEPGNISSGELAKVFGIKRFDQQTGATIEKTSLQDWSSAELLKSKLAKIRGSVRFPGNSAAKLGKTVTLAGLGKRFNGNVWVSAVHHCVANGSWTTTVELGLSAQWFAAETPHIAAPPASGQLPPIEGLQTGVVKQVAKDPGAEFRVLVNLPLLKDDAKGVWARLAGFYASNKLGAVFYPEVGDEVVVGFMNQDPRYAVILGSVYSKKRPPPYPPDEKNTLKALVTSSKLEITFDEKDKVIEIKTPGKHVIRLDDKADTLTLSDANKNRISMAKGGITIESGANLTLTAKGNITVDAKGNLAEKAAANATLEALQISQKAKTKYAANGAATAELTSSGMLTVRGSLVKIN